MKKISSKAHFLMALLGASSICLNANADLPKASATIVDKDQIVSFLNGDQEALKDPHCITKFALNDKYARASVSVGRVISYISFEYGYGTFVRVSTGYGDPAKQNGIISFDCELK